MYENKIITLQEPNSLYKFKIINIIEIYIISGRRHSYSLWINDRTNEIINCIVYYNLDKANINDVVKLNNIDYKVIDVFNNKNEENKDILI
ncbi:MULTISPECIES: hypothetical protein [Acinetobacter]|uniref:hypothetical protein n=1 Tax=Acinetobacter TaxID=469 RepID=UPI0018A2A916|nr:MULTISPECIES: hypothetical protein [Acinetobacter]MBF7691643.1 hypothetical protein [Acinetobacter pollinis]MBF7699290.1 hypothetical protein [Acinetobacter pollinis]MCF9000220.1 hypothetical protein [Acinetobacter nectaris]MCF9028457.1 hypothetical protein [Acinetobacter nectaris]